MRTKAILPKVRKKSIYFKLTGEKDKKASRLSLKDIYYYIGNNVSLLVDRLTENSAALLAVLPVTKPDTSQPDIMISADLIDCSSGNTIPIDFHIISGRNEEKKALILGEICLPELNYGDYRLIFTAQDPVSRVSSRRKIDFSMK